LHFILFVSGMGGGGGEGVLAGE